MTVNTRAAALAVLAGIGVLSGCSSTSTNEVAEDCQPASEFSTITEGTLTVVGPDYPPLFTYEDNRLGGVDGDIIRSFAEANCLDTRVNVLPAAGVIEAVSGGQADVAGGGWYPTEERADVVNQTDPAYADPAVLVGKNPSSELSDYEGQTIGTTQGYLWVEDLQAWAGDNAKLYASPDAVFQDLLAGRIDVAMMAVNEAAFRLDQAPEDSGLSYVELTPTDLVEATTNPSVTNLPHTKENQELTDALNEHLAQLRDSGELAEILESYNIEASFAEPQV